MVFKGESLNSLIRKVNAGTPISIKFKNLDKEVPGFLGKTSDGELYVAQNSMNGNIYRLKYGMKFTWWIGHTRSRMESNNIEFIRVNLDSYCKYFIFSTGKKDKEFLPVFSRTEDIAFILASEQYPKAKLLKRLPKKLTSCSVCGENIGGPIIEVGTCGNLIIKLLCDECNPDGEKTDDIIRYAEPNDTHDDEYVDDDDHDDDYDYDYSDEEDD